MNDTKSRRICVTAEKWKCAVALFCLGGSVYVMGELLYRQRSHASMFIAGGLSVALINAVCNGCKPMKKRCLALKALIGGTIITAVEYLTGLIVNVKMGLAVWDYSHLPLNLNGQICFHLSALWILLAIPAIYIGKLINPE